MIKLIDTHKFIFGVIVGVIGAGVLSKGVKKLFNSKVTIIQIDLNDIEGLSGEIETSSEIPNNIDLAAAKKTEEIK